VVGTPGFFSWRKKRETRKSRYSDWAGFSSYWSKISTFSNFPPQPGPNKLHTHPNPIVVHLYSPPPPDPPSRTPQSSATARRRRTPHAAPAHRRCTPAPARSAGLPPGSSRTSSARCSSTRSRAGPLRRVHRQRLLSGAQAGEIFNVISTANVATDV
jgi:hypothetical protein